MAKKSMNGGEKMVYDNALKNLLNSLHETYEINQNLINLKIKDVDAKISKLESYIKGIKTRLNNETLLLREAISEAKKVREKLDTTINDMDAETLDRIKKISEIIVYGWY